MAAPMTFLTNASLEWNAEPAKSWADVAVDEPTGSLRASTTLSSASAPRESATVRLQRMRDASASSRAASASSFSERLRSAARATGTVPVVQFASRVSAAAGTTANDNDDDGGAGADGDADAKEERRRQNQLDRAERKRRRVYARTKDASEKAKRSAAAVAQHERAAAREAVKQANAQRRVDAQREKKRKVDELHAAGLKTPGEELAELQVRKLFIRLVGWTDKAAEHDEALRRTRIRLLRAVLLTFGAISSLKFDFPHNSGFVAFADAAAAAAALEQLSTPERRALALRNAAQALALEPNPLDGESFVLKRAAYLKRSKAHKKAKTTAQFVAAKTAAAAPQ
jgi:hypothetical protein